MFLLCLDFSTLLRQESIVTVRGVPMTDYMENAIKSTMASKSGQVLDTFKCAVPFCNWFLHARLSMIGGQVMSS